VTAVVVVAVWAVLVLGVVLFVSGASRGSDRADEAAADDLRRLAEECRVEHEQLRGRG
jgi:hypothetical protein